MAVTEKKVERASLGDVVESGVHLPQTGAAHSSDPHQDHDHKHAFELLEVQRVVFVALAAAAVWFHLWEPFHRISVIGLAATLIGGYPIFKEAFENIVERRMTMELSMTIALV
jgi:cation transport ATPase